MRSSRTKGPLKQPGTPLAAVKSVTSVSRVSAEERARMVALAAYFRSQKRGFDPGRDLQDWLEAEAEVDATLGLRPARR
ncbi:MAG: hypothetical protein A3F77_05770 [Betaproteobacteria bacterium RIFCSPLOWO2_12_FULL_67_28]|nr:MAG: hypothetical protein A3I65_05985 [Betaproteobacteria bacterium RIFCSPLOWO2_02_FULL_68_150]OGA64863.1 MAG: hypothetical protein A3F77_05770 [Betaproteobacteria bacterium RIFCSPLOWO2_12_FULL_67_28]